MKNCPYCAEEIQDAAIVCKHCGRPLPGSESHVPDRVSHKKPVKKPRRSGPLLFGLAVLVLAFSAIAVVFTQGGLNVRILPTPTITPVPTAESCYLQAQPFFQDSQRLLDEWLDADDIAGSTPRMSLGPALADLQRIKRDVDNLVVPECAAYLHFYLSNGMDESIKGYLAFLSQESDQVVNNHFENAEREFENYVETLRKIKAEATPAP